MENNLYYIVESKLCLDIQFKMQEEFRMEAPFSYIGNLIQQTLYEFKAIRIPKKARKEIGYKLKVELDLRLPSDFTTQYNGTYKQGRFVIISRSKDVIILIKLIWRHSRSSIKTEIEEIDTILEDSTKDIIYLLASKKPISTPDFLRILELNEHSKCPYANALLPKQVKKLPTDFIVEREKPLFQNKEIAEIIGSAKQSISIINPYIDPSILSIIVLCPDCVNVKIIGKNFKDERRKRKIIAGITSQTKEKAKSIEVRQNLTLHDRFIIIDDQHIWHCGRDIQDIGKKMITVTYVREQEVQQKVVADFATKWKEGKLIYI